MNEQSQGNSYFSPADQLVKRKRGRPRKDDTQLHGENLPVVPGSDSVKKNKQIVGASNAAVDDMVGQMVSGVIEGSFDAGYLLNVKVGDTDAQLRGVVFLPGRFTPISAANDVAPNSKMYKRKEIPIPVQDSQSQQHNFVPPSEQINQQATEFKKDEPTIPDQFPPSGLQSGVPTVGENQSDPVMTPVANKLLMNETGLSLGEKPVPQQISESVFENQAASIMAQLKRDKVVEQSQVEPDTNMDIQASKKLEPVSAPFVDMMPCTENVNEQPQVELQPLSSDLKPNHLVSSEVKSLNIEENQNAVFTKPESMPLENAVFTKHKSMTSEPTGISFLMDNPSLEQNQIPLSAEPKIMPSQLIGTDIIIEKQNSPRKDTPEDALLELAKKTIAGEDRSLAVGESANVTASGSCSSSAPSLSVMMFGGEAISSQPEIGTEGSVLPRIIGTQICNSSAATNDADSDMKAATHLDLSGGVNLSRSG